MTRGRLLVGSWVAVTLTICLGDHFFHVRTGILRHHWRPFVDGQSVWVWLIFAVAAAAFVGVAAAVPLRDVPADVPWPAIVDSTALFIGAYALSGQLGASHPAGLFVALVAVWLIRIAVRPTDRLWYAAHGIVLAAAGVVGEGLFSDLGLFDYRLQQVMNCPWWLAGLYLQGSIALLEVARGATALAGQRSG
ncbi:hypothetical protein [Mycobacterium sp.]|uniref:hypothetical protein n=1 Tax=Mycobacterium sp. TaxID=1785 RepID=UPI003BAFE159